MDDFDEVYDFEVIHGLVPVILTRIAHSACVHPFIRSIGSMNPG